MTILSENIKTIRKSLSCTQMALSEVLDIGFRTYVRYEAGERDAPIAILIKLAKLGNISLDRLLTTKITEKDLETPDTEILPATSRKLEVLGGSLEEGRLMFKGIRPDFLVTTNPDEKKLLTQFRKMDRVTQDQFLVDQEWALNHARSAPPTSKRKKVSRKTLKAKNAAQLKRVAKSIKKITLKG